MIQPKENIAANCFVLQGAKPQTAADATYVSSEIYDRLAVNNGIAQSAMGIAIACFTSSGGGSDGVNTLTILVEHGDNSGLSDAATLDSYTYAYNWKANGANDGVHCLPIDLSTAKRYLRLKAKLTKSGTITCASQQLASCLIIGGMKKVPSAGYVAAGYEETTEAA